MQEVQCERQHRVMGKLSGTHHRGVQPESWVGITQKSNWSNTVDTEASSKVLLFIRFALVEAELGCGVGRECQ